MPNARRWLFWGIDVRSVSDYQSMYIDNQTTITNHTQVLPFLCGRGLTIQRTEPGEYRLWDKDKGALLGEASLASGYLITMTESELPAQEVIAN